MADGIVQIEITRVVSHSIFEFLECGGKGPEARVCAQSNPISVDPTFHPIPPALRLRWGWPKVTTCPFKVGHHEQVVLIEPETNFRTESCTL